MYGGWIEDDAGIDDGGGKVVMSAVGSVENGESGFETWYGERIGLGGSPKG
jgi:hypothetical protein